MLKKLSLFIAAACIITSALFAQRVKWEESFADDLIQNRGWSLVNNDNGSADIELYKPFEFFGIGDQNAESGTYFFRLGFESANRFNLIDDWIVTPQLFSIHEGDSISFWCGAVDKQFKDSLKVWISVVDNQLTSFNMIDYFKVPGPVGSWHKRSYDLSAYAGKNIYLAVNYYIKNGGANGTAGDVVWVDHFKLTGKGNGGVTPGAYKLYQNFPNPFNPATDISFDVPAESRVTINIYNTLGQQVTQLVNSNYKPGSYSVNFDASNFASGVYFYRITAGEFTDEKKMVLVK